MGANAAVFVARPASRGALREHGDVMLVLKVLFNYHAKALVDKCALTHVMALAYAMTVCSL